MFCGRTKGGDYPRSYLECLYCSIFWFKKKKMPLLLYKISYMLIVLCITLYLFSIHVFCVWFKFLFDHFIWHCKFMLYVFFLCYLYTFHKKKGKGHTHLFHLYRPMALVLYHASRYLSYQFTNQYRNTSKLYQSRCRTLPSILGSTGYFGQ